MSEKSSSDQPDLSDDELRETLDRLAALSLDMSDRLEEQTKAINRISTAASEARRAAKAAEQQTDPDQYAEFAVELIDTRLGNRMDQIKELVGNITRASNHTQGVLKEAETDRGDAMRAVWEREQKVERLKSRLPWLGLGAVVLALAMTVLLPRFLASNSSTCAVIGATWTATTEGVNACVFYQP
jgi:hypothetical protein